MSIQLNSSERFTWLEMPGESVEDERMQKLFAKAKSVLGFVPNVFLGYTIRPSHFAPWFSHFREVTEGESELSRAEREMISVQAGFSEKVPRTLDYRRAGLDERTTAILDYALKITAHPVDCSEQDIQKLRALGFSDRAIFDIAEVAAMFNYTNRMALATGMLPNREYHAMAR